MSKSAKEVLSEARSIAETEPDRAKKMLEDLATSRDDVVRFDAEIELAMLAYGSWMLDEVAERAESVLKHSTRASPSASAVAGILLEVVHDFKDESIDERMLAISSAACIAASEPYMAAVGLALSARLRLGNGERDVALRLLAQAEEQYDAAGSMLGVPGIALRLASIHADAGDFDSADAAVQRGLAHLARFPYGGQGVRLLAQKLRAAAEDYAKRSESLGRT